MPLSTNFGVGYFISSSEWEIIDRKLLDQDTSDKQGPGLNGLNLGADS